MTTTLSDGLQSNKALFLDFDGVLHTAEKAANLARGLIPFDLVAYAHQMDMFCWNSALEAALVSDPSITVFVHSSWRSHVNNQELLTLLGPLAHRFVGVTPKGAARYDGILQMVQQAGLDDYRILDDMPHEFPVGCPELIVCDPSLGITGQSVRDALELWLSANPLVPSTSRASFTLTV